MSCSLVRVFALGSVLLIGCSGAPMGGPSETAALLKSEDQRQLAQGAQAKKQLERKVIHTGTLHLVVEDFAAAREQLDQVVQEFKGAFVEHYDVSGAAGSRRTGQWKLRVPAETHPAFVARLRGLGEPVRATLDARDVTVEDYDVEADLRNKKVEEEGFQNLVKTAPTFDNVLAAKREVERVRNEINRLQKRFEVLADLTTLATVDLTIQERKDYVPETTTFGGTIGRTWTNSWDALVTFGKNLVLVVVALTPWLLALALLAVVVVPVVWWRRKRTAV